MNKLTFTTTGAFDLSNGFGCASLGLPGVCDNDVPCVVTFEKELRGIVIAGTYSHILQKAAAVTEPVYAAIVLFGNAGGENTFLRQLQSIVHCPMVGGGAAIDAASGKSGLITGHSDCAVLLITDDRYLYRTETLCIHDTVVDTCSLELQDPRTILKINGEDAGAFLQKHKQSLGLPEMDFEHLTLCDQRGVNAHLSCQNGVIKSGRDLGERMLLRYVEHGKVYDTMRNFYDEEGAIIFGCAGLSGLLDKPLDTKSLGLFLFGEVCCVDGVSEFGNLMLSKLIITEK